MLNHRDTDGGSVNYSASVPQGFVMDPLLFTVCVNDLLEYVTLSYDEDDV